MEMVGKITALKRQTNPERAQELLEQVYRYTLPIMRKHNLKVKLLTEFLPRDPNLLGINVNRGQKIAIRLRPSHNPGSFLNFEDLLGTMLHELTHNLHGPHNAVFFEYMDKLKSELQGMLLQGFKGDKWYSGRRLGAQAGRASLAQMTSTTPASAASRAALLRQGKRLGGAPGTAPPYYNIPLRDRTLAAAERRRQLDKVCPADKPLPEIELVDLTAEEEDDQSVIDLT